MTVTPQARLNEILNYLLSDLSDILVRSLDQSESSSFDGETLNDQSSANELRMEQMFYKSG